jgi:Flp pilus assembly pilin Flp
MTKLSVWATTLYFRLKREEGQSLVEWTLILALISVVAIALLEAIGLNIVAKLTVIRDKLA